MRPLVHTFLPALSQDALDEFIAARRSIRLVTPKRPPKRRTIKSLAKAWNVPEERVRQAVLELMAEDERAELLTETKQKPR